MYQTFNEKAKKIQHTQIQKVEGPKESQQETEIYSSCLHSKQAETHLKKMFNHKHLEIVGYASALASEPSVQEFNATSHSRQNREKCQMTLWRFPVLQPRLRGRNSMFLLRLILADANSSSRSLCSPLTSYYTFTVHTRTCAH